MHPPAIDSTTASNRNRRCTVAVDTPMARRLLRLFLELNRLGTAVVIATHDLSLMDQVEARRMILSQGQLEIYE